MLRRILVVAACSLATLVSAPAYAVDGVAPKMYRLKKVSTVHVRQLTGTLRNPGRNVGITGTDLGVSFAIPSVKDRLILLFGDSWTVDKQRWDQDSAAWAPAALDVARDPELDWFKSTQFTEIKTPGVHLGGMNVPVEGLVIDGRVYVFASTGWDNSRGRHCCSVLAHTSAVQPEFDQLVLDHRVTSNKFINVSAFVEDGTVFIFGSGAYRQSPVYLAKVHSSQIANRSQWRYYHGRKNGKPIFVKGEEDAQPIVSHQCVGELSARHVSDLGYLLLYNCGDQGTLKRGIHLRRADRPWGPWDPAINIFEPELDKGYGYFMHAKFSRVGYDDGLAEPGIHTNIIEDKDCPGYGWREECDGGEYGPYLVPQWSSRGSDGTVSIFYTLSTWVPYQVHLMRTVLARRDAVIVPAPVSAPEKAREVGAFIGDFGGTGDCHLSGWQSIGDRFQVFRGEDGRCRFTTYSPEKGDAAMGSVFQDFIVEPDRQAIRFYVHGGEGTVRLHRGAEIVRESRGRSGHEPRNFPETLVCWQLGSYAGETLRIAIVDTVAGNWGFIGVNDIRFSSTPCATVK